MFICTTLINCRPTKQKQIFSVQNQSQLQQATLIGVAADIIFLRYPYMGRGNQRNAVNQLSYVG